MKCVRNGGFTILEWLISFCIIVTVLTVVFQFSAKICSQLLGNSKRNTMFTELYVAFDTMSKQISQAPPEKDKWVHVANNQLSWKDVTSHERLGYLYEKQKLFFVKGKRKNLLANNVNALQFSANVERDQVKSIQCEATFMCNKKKYLVTRVMSLKNREVL